MKVHALALTLGALVLAFSVSAQDAVKSGEGERKISMIGCNGLKIYGEWKVEIVPSENSDCIIKEAENVLQQIRIQHKNGYLTVQSKGLFSSEGKGTIMIPLKYLPLQNRFTGASKIGIRGVLKKDTRWTLTKGASLEIEGISASRFSIHANDTCSVTIRQGTIELTTLHLSRNASADLTGQFNRLELHMSGSAKADVKTCMDARVSARNDSVATVACTKKLNAACSGSAQIFYSGSPVLTQKVSGSGTISKK